MALLTWNGTDFDTNIGATTIQSANLTLSTAGISSTGITAPNLTNKITGVWIFIASLTGGGNITAEIMESGVSKATATINFADMVVGFNYLRFPTPYQFATLSAGAYVCRLKNTTQNNGTVTRFDANLWMMFTYDSASAVGASDDVWVGGFHNAGMTPKTLTLTGISNSWGSNTDKILGSASRAMGGAVQIGAGGTFKFDQTASTSLTLKGNVFVGAPTGLFDMRPGSNKAIVSTLSFDSITNGDHGLFTASGAFGGRILTAGATYDAATTYASGLGTAASPLIVQAGWDADVGDEIVIGGGTTYALNEIRYIKTRNSATSFVLSATPGGAESALANTHAVGSHIGNLQRNSIVKATVSTRGWYANTSPSAVAAMDFSYTRMENSHCGSGYGLTFVNTLTSNIDGIVLYGNSSTGRGSLHIGNGSVAQTYSNIILYNQQGTNYSGQSGFQIQSASGKTFNRCFSFNAPTTALNCALFSFITAANGNTFTDCHSYGANATNAGAGYAVGFFSSNGNIFRNCSFNGTRQNATYYSSSLDNRFYNCTFGDKTVNGNDVGSLTQTLNTGKYEDCSFSSPTLVSGYLTLLEGSEFTFQNMDGNTSKHRWINNHGSFWSSGSGLTDTTVRTAGSLALAIKPEDNTVGSSWEFLIPAVPASQCGIFGYGYRNATFSAGTFKVELFLPGSTVADASYTFSTSTGSWLPFNISAYYAGSVTRYAKVRITAVSATAGAYAFIDDLYDAGTGNKLAGLDLWHEGKPSEIMVAADYAAIPAQVWGYSDANTNANTMGQRQVDASDNAEFAAFAK